MTGRVIDKPDATEYPAYFARYIDLVQEDVLTALATQIRGTLATLRNVPDDASFIRYAPDKWSLRDVVGHVIDVERVFAYRALRFARNDPQELSGFEQDEYVAAAVADRRAWAALLDELELVRHANVLMFRGFAPEAWRRTGVADRRRISVRAIAYAIAGHELHHMRIVREKYLSSTT